MKKFIKCLAITLTVLAMFGALSSYVEGIDSKILVAQSKSTLVVYKEPITRQMIFH